MNFLEFVCTVFSSSNEADDSCENENQQVNERQSHFEIEHYPETNRYYPKYRGKYIRRSVNTGIYELRDSFLFAYADYGKTEEEADQIIALFKEQQLKENVRIIPR